jgi:hypothetical protein
MKTLTPSQEAFVRAYAQIVASAPENIVRAYFDYTDDEEFYKQYPHEYASVTDAYLMWEASRRYEAGEIA